MQLAEPLQLPHVLLQGRVSVEVVQHAAVQGLEGNSAPIMFHPCSGFGSALAVSCVYLHEHFDVLVLPQEVSAQRHPL